MIDRVVILHLLLNLLRMHHHRTYETTADSLTLLNVSLSIANYLRLLVAAVDLKVTCRLLTKDTLDKL